MIIKQAFLGVFQKIMAFCIAMTMFAITPANAVNLPSGYTELEYIESTGTQYIDTGGTGFNTGSWEIYAKWMLPVATQPKEYANVFSVYAGEDYNSYRVIINKKDSSKYYVSGNSKAAGGSVALGGRAINQIHTATARNGSVIFDGETITTPDKGTALPESASLGIFARSDGVGKIIARIYSVNVKKDGALIRNFVPAKNSSGVIGLYDTVSGTFFTNAGTGEFIAAPEVLNPCRNLYNKANGVLYGYPSQSFVWQQKTGPTAELSIMLKLTEGETYTVQRVAGAGTSAFRIQASSTETLTQGQQLVNIRSNSSANVQTFTVPNGAPYVIFYVRNVYNANGAANTSSLTLDQVIDGFQIEQGSTATEYVPYNASCHNTNSIKIATRAYNTTQFAPVVTALNTAVNTIKDVVTNTINQTAAVSALQSTKQTRPDDGCPQYKQCLLVETEDGTPHWFVITDPFRDLFSPVIANNIAATDTTSQNAYTQLQYIYMMDGSYLSVTNQSITSDYKIEFDFATTNLSSNLANYFGARASGVAAGGGFRVTKLSNQGVAMYGFDTTDAYETGANILTANTRYKYVYENGTCKLSSGGTDVLTHTYTVNDTSTITAFGINAYTSNGTSFSASNLGIYCYGLKMWNGQGELVMNLVPAIQGTTIGFFDTVTGDLRGPSAGTFTAGPTVSNQNAAWTATFGANDTYGYGRSIVYGTATCNATSGSANDVATATQIAAANWTATGSNCWCYAERVSETGSGSTGTSTNRWVYLTVPSGETCAVNCVENCANAVASGATADKPFRQALTGI